MLIDVFVFICENFQLLEKDANTRMGAPNSPHEDITENVFFNEIDWKKLERRMLEPPFKPQVVKSIISLLKEVNAKFSIH